MFTSLHTARSAVAGVHGSRARIALPDWIGAMHGVWRQRRILSELDQRALDDIGISREAALREAARPVWDVPAGWLR
jgi:uncharacterized protein YjiS (DUF1127 family)